MENARDSVEPATAVPTTSGAGPYGRAVGIVAFTAAAVGSAVGVHAGTSLFGVATAVMVSAIAVLVIVIRGSLPSFRADRVVALEILIGMAVVVALTMRLID